MLPTLKVRPFLFVSALLVPVFIFGQENGDVGWDPKELPPAAWLEGIRYGVLLLYCYGYWRGLRWLVNRYRKRSYWPRVRLLAPVFMMCLSAACFVASHFGDFLVALLLAVTLPGLLPAVLLVGVLEIQRWEALLLGTALVWPAWYALIRFTEWYLDITRPISLRIT